MSPQAFEKLQTLQARVQNYSVAQSLWQQSLTPAEKAQLGCDLQTAWSRHKSTLGIAAHVWNCTPAKALLRIYRQLGDLPPATIRWLERELGESSDEGKSDAAVPRPIWNKEEGCLYFAGKAIRIVRSVIRATNIVQVLDAFQTKNWPTRIPNPLPADHDDLVRQTVQSLNRGLAKIRFYTDGMGVRWRKL
jgi:hypothetical protein